MEEKGSLCWILTYLFYDFMSLEEKEETFMRTWPVLRISLDDIV